MPPYGIKPLLPQPQQQTDNNNDDDNGNDSVTVNTPRFMENVVLIALDSKFDALYRHIDGKMDTIKMAIQHIQNIQNVMTDDKTKKKKNTQKLQMVIVVACVMFMVIVVAGCCWMGGSNRGLHSHPSSSSSIDQYNKDETVIIRQFMEELWHDMHKQHSDALKQVHSEILKMLASSPQLQRESHLETLLRHVRRLIFNF